MLLQSENLNDYLQATQVVDWDNPCIKHKTDGVLNGLTTDVDKAKTLFEWVRDKIPHSKDINSDLVTCKASEVLEKGTGICYAKSHLLAAMCRYAGIPAGFCYQVYGWPPPDAGTAIHGFNAIYLASIRKWIRVDARGNTGDINAQFGIDEERLAFPVDPAKGELFIYNMVFTDPVPQVVDVLIRYKNRTEMWPRLPLMINDEFLCKEDRVLNATLNKAFLLDEPEK
jgi:hypothetical protein